MQSENTENRTKGKMRRSSENVITWANSEGLGLAQSRKDKRKR